MSHELYEYDSAMYGSKVPAWHNLGTVVEGQPNSEDAIKLANLDWKVIKEQALIDNGEGGTIKVPNLFFTVRDDIPKNNPNRVLGVVHKRYAPIQNVEAFAIADELIGEGGARFETAGSLRNGKLVWMLAVLPEQSLVKDDKLNQYLLLTSSHDGSKALEAMFTPVRVVCWNTLTVAIRGAKTRVSIRHTHNAKSSIAEAKRILGLATTYFGELVDIFNIMSEKAINDRFVRAYLEALIPDKSEKSKRASNIRETILSLYNGGQSGYDYESIRGTAYGLYNAVTEYIDHSRGIRLTGSKTKEQARMESVMFGSGANLRQRAFDLMRRAVGVDIDGQESLVSLATKVN